MYTNAEFDFINQEIKILESDIYNALSKSYKIETYYDIIKKYKDTQFDKHLKQFCQNNNQYKDVYKWQFDKVKTEDLYNSIVDSSQITLIKSKITETEENETMINTLLNEFNKEYNEIYSEINNYEKNKKSSYIVGDFINLLHKVNNLMKSYSLYVKRGYTSKDDNINNTLKSLKLRIEDIINELKIFDLKNKKIGRAHV